MRLHGFNREVTPSQIRAYSRHSVESQHDEAQFEGWLHSHPSLLLTEPVVVFSRQPSIETGTPDILALDQFGNVVIFEIKTGESGSKSASEESIIGQPLSYSQALAPYEYGELDALYQQYRERVLDGRWKTGDESVPKDTLQNAFEGKFGRPLAPSQFNDKQRVVIVAESITPRTAENARYLLQQGYSIQCQEVQLFTMSSEDPSETFIVASSTVVDYPLRDVRPMDNSHPAYPELNRTIIERTFREIGELVGADSPRDLVQGFDERQPRIQSEHPGHPETVTYRLYLNPEQETVLVAIDIDATDEESLSQILNHEHLFDRDGFEVTGNTRNRVVIDSWLVRELKELDDEALDEIAQQYASLVRIGHRTFTR